MFWFFMFLSIYLLIGVVMSSFLIKELEYTFLIKELEYIIEEYENGETMSEADEILLDQLDEINKRVKNSNILLIIVFTLFWLPILIDTLIEKS